MTESDRSIFNIMIYPEFQVPNLMLVLATAFSVFVIMGAFCYLQMRIIYATVSDPQQLKVINGILWKYGTICLGALLFSTAMMIFWSLLQTHRVVGAIPRLKEQLDEMFQEKSISLLRIREYDYMQTFFEKINKVLLSLTHNCREFEGPTSTDTNPTPGSD